jgi:hypothetical protein
MCRVCSSVNGLRSLRTGFTKSIDHGTDELKDREKLANGIHTV